MFVTILFRTTPGTTDVSVHYIPTSCTPARVPPHRIPVVVKSKDKVLQQGIIESSSPWMAPAVCSEEMSELNLCVPVSVRLLSHVCPIYVSPVSAVSQCLLSPVYLLSHVCPMCLLSHVCPMCLLSHECPM